MLLKHIAAITVRFVKWTFGLLATLVLAASAFIVFAPSFGANPSGDSLERVKASSQYRNGEFINLIKTILNTRKPGDSMEIATYFFPPDDKNPSEPIQATSFKKAEFKENEFVWFGHSTVLFNSGGLNIIADPVFNRASPVPFVGQPFQTNPEPSFDQLPDIDVVLISHDHYDHLDHITIGDLSKHTGIFLVPLGLQNHLVRWGVSADKIVELDWYHSHVIQDSTFTLTPSRHFSGRGIFNRNSTLWGSWVIETPDASIFFSGDSGYFDEFKKIGDKFGPFDIAFIENGAYNEAWAQIHLMPEESAQTAIDLQAKLFFPIHWGKFDLAEHRWTEPADRALAAANELGVSIVTPLIGEVFTVNNAPVRTWWQ